MTILILVVGMFLVFSVSGQEERDRRALMERIALGDGGERVVELLAAEPLRCPGTDLGHLRESFPEGWSSAAVDLAIERLGQVTAERWVFSTDGAPVAMCTSTDRVTEVGIDSGGAVVWLVPVLGRSFVRVPPWLQPGGPSDTDSVSPPTGGR